MRSCKDSHYLFFLQYLQLHLCARSVLMRRVYESSLSALMQQIRIENITKNAPAIGIISARNAGI